MSARKRFRPAQALASKRFDELSEHGLGVANYGNGHTVVLSEYPCIKVNVNELRRKLESSAGRDAVGQTCSDHQRCVALSDEIEHWVPAVDPPTNGTPQSKRMVIRNSTFAAVTGGHRCAEQFRQLRKFRRGVRRNNTSSSPNERMLGSR